MIGIIGGSGLTALAGLQITEQIQMQTPYGEPSAPVVKGHFQNQPVLFLPRHGEHHTLPPHLINYRANLWALHHLGARDIIAVAAVGSLNQTMPPGQLVIPDQLIDYTWGRESSLFSEDFSPDKHIDFTYPYDERLRQQLLTAAKSVQLQVSDGGTYAVTQGPRLETAAEIRRLQKDGADIVGMTAMPEAALARELNMAYATIAVVANLAAGLGTETLTMDSINDTVQQAMARVLMLISTTLEQA
jgi:5'-methylthioinosine phosphorylase